VFDLFNQEAAASDPAGIHKYSEDLIQLLVPSDAQEEYRASLVPLADRLTHTEQISRAGKGKLITEADVFRRSTI
jgi:hypothetical protein